VRQRAATYRENIWSGESVSIAVEKNIECMHGDDQKNGAFANLLESAARTEIRQRA